MNRPLRILHVAPSFFPATAFGGPIWATKLLCDHLTQREDITLNVLTTNTSGDVANPRLELVSDQEWFAAGYHVRYCSRRAGVSVSTELLRRLPTAIAQSDLVHLTGVYSFPTVPVLGLCRAFRKPLLWSPHGALQASANLRHVPKAGPKWMFEQICRLVRPACTALHVNSPMEAEASANRLPQLPAFVVPNPIIVPAQLPQREWRPRGTLRVMFLGRLHPIKGLDLLIDALAASQSHVVLDVFGGGAPDYEAALHQQVAARGLQNRIRFHGHAEGAAKSEAFERADVLCLPTRSDSFGLVVAEALAHGVPAITTAAAPWRELVTHQCGLSVEPHSSALCDALQTMRQEDLAAMGERGRAWIGKAFAPSSIAAQIAETYHVMIEGKPGADLVGRRWNWRSA